MTDVNLKFTKEKRTLKRRDKIIEDNRNVGQATDLAYHSIRSVKKRPVDIVVGTNSRFEKKRSSEHTLMVEGEVERNGILLYDQMEQRSMPA